MKRIAVICLGAFVVAVIGLGTVGCEKSYKDKNPEAVQQQEKKVADQKADSEKAKQEAEKQEPPKPVVAQPEWCFGKEDSAAKKEFEVGGVKYELAGNFRLNALNADPKKPVVLGTIDGIKSYLPKTIENLTAFYEDFKKANVTAVLITGDSSDKLEDLTQVFDFLGKQGLLTLVLIGNRERVDHFNQAVSEAQKKYPNLINLNQVRVVNLGGATLVSLPGYYNPEYIHQQPGCAYGAAQIEEVKKLAAGAKNPVVLVSHGPPQGVGETSIDYAQTGKNVGDPQITTLIKDAKIPFGIFGNIQEAGGKAVGIDLKAVLEQGKPFANLYLNSGAADSDPWMMNDNTRSEGMCAVVTVENSKASYKIIRRPVKN